MFSSIFIISSVLDLEAVSTGRCGKSYDPCIFTKNPLIGAGEPVCGSDKLSYVSIQALWCVRKTGKRGKYLYVLIENKFAVNSIFRPFRIMLHSSIR